ncbi:unnamed protein product [Sphenostylis stenocarpa]|uniref:Uncharacterized protein n=1 Tax=Sphenostylis stenocarpa TaxID=92480 RepID=A0AA86T0I8_9FABA|nr:unnamed protein product [Sphenostylis stenocarpa]
MDMPAYMTCDPGFMLCSEEVKSNLIFSAPSDSLFFPTTVIKVATNNVSLSISSHSHVHTISSLFLPLNFISASSHFTFSVSSISAKSPNLSSISEMPSEPPTPTLASASATHHLLT